MAISNRQKPYQDLEQEEEEEEDHSTESERSDSDCDSDTDPSYSIIEEARSKLSSLSIRKKSKSRVDKDPDELEKNLAGVDEKSYEQVQKIIQAEKLEKLKVEQCKVYLRKNGLRLTGNKEILIQRIKEHQQILNGGGEKKYPISSFVFDCKGDACTGDVVMFEQKVYETYNVASRSASGPPCGSRIVAGRIVKESYGAAKQQHTFTIEVLWSKGHKPHPPLHPLLIKGRNLYRLKTLRQRWEDEGQRRKVLMEKHSRGSLARSNRETRIQEKERRKMLRENRALKKDETNKSQFQLNFRFKTNMGIPAQQSGSSANCVTVTSHHQHMVDLGAMAIRTNKSEASVGVQAQQQAIQPQNSGSSILPVIQQPTSLSQYSGPSANAVKTEGLQQQEIQPQSSDSMVDTITVGSGPQKSNVLGDSAKSAAFYVESQKLGVQCDLQKKRRDDDQDRVSPNSMKRSGNQEVQQHISAESRKLGIRSDLEKDQIDYDRGQVPCNSMTYSGIQDFQQHRRDDFGSRSTNFQVKNCQYPGTSWNEELSKRDRVRPLKFVNHYHPTSQPMPPHRKPLTSVDHSSPIRSPHRQGYQQPKFQKDQRENDYRNHVPYNSVKCSGIENVDQHRSDYYGPRSHNFYMNDGHSPVNKYPCANRNDGFLKRNYHSRPLTSTNHNRPMSPPSPHRRSLTNTNQSSPLRSPHRQSYRHGYQQVQQLCRYYARGRCYYGDNCKFLHELPETADESFTNDRSSEMECHMTQENSHQSSRKSLSDT